MRIKDLLAPTFILLSDLNVRQVNQPYAVTKENFFEKATLEFEDRRELLNALNLLLASSEEEATPETLKPYINILEQRWARIRTSHLDYNFAHDHPLTLLCLGLANLLGEFLQLSRFKILMPTLEVIENDLSAELIDNLQLHEFVLSDDGKRFINVSYTLFMAADRELRCFTHNCSFENWQEDNLPPTFKTLTAAEIDRVTNHSKLSGDYYQKTKALLARQYDDSVGGVIMHFIRRLRNSGAHGGRLGMDVAADTSEVALACFDFYKFLKTLNIEKRTSLFACKYTYHREDGELYVYHFEYVWLNLFSRCFVNDKIQLPLEIIRNDDICLEELSAIRRRLREIASPRLLAEIPCVEEAALTLQTLLTMNPFLRDMKSDDAARAAPLLYEMQETSVKDSKIALQHALTRSNYALPSFFKTTTENLLQETYRQIYQREEQLARAAKELSPEQLIRLLRCSLVTHFQNQTKTLSQYVKILTILPTPVYDVFINEILGPVHLQSTLALNAVMFFHTLKHSPKESHGPFMAALGQEYVINFINNRSDARLLVHRLGIELAKTLFESLVASEKFIHLVVDVTDFIFYWRHLPHDSIKNYLHNNFSAEKLVGILGNDPQGLMSGSLQSIYQLRNVLIYLSPAQQSQFLRRSIRPEKLASLLVKMSDLIQLLENLPLETQCVILTMLGVNKIASLVVTKDDLLIVVTTLLKDPSKEIKIFLSELLNQDSVQEILKLISRSTLNQQPCAIKLFLLASLNLNSHSYLTTFNDLPLEEHEKYLSLLKDEKLQEYTHELHGLIGLINAISPLAIPLLLYRIRNTSLITTVSTLFKFGAVISALQKKSVDLPKFCCDLMQVNLKKILGENFNPTEFFMLPNEVQHYCCKLFDESVIEKILKQVSDLYLLFLTNATQETLKYFFHQPCVQTRVYQLVNTPSILEFLCNVLRNSKHFSSDHVISYFGSSIFMNLCQTPDDLVRVLTLFSPEKQSLLLVRRLTASHLQKLITTWNDFQKIYAVLDLENRRLLIKMLEEKLICEIEMTAANLAMIFNVLLVTKQHQFINKIFDLDKFDSVMKTHEHLLVILRYSPATLLQRITPQELQRLITTPAELNKVFIYVTADDLFALLCEKLGAQHLRVLMNLSEDKQFSLHYLSAANQIKLNNTVNNNEQENNAANISQVGRANFFHHQVVQGAVIVTSPVPQV